MQKYFESGLKGWKRFYIRKLFKKTISESKYLYIKHHYNFILPFFSVLENLDNVDSDLR
jgi:hypothetical protein